MALIIWFSVGFISPFSILSKDISDANKLIEHRSAQRSIAATKLCCFETRIPKYEIRNNIEIQMFKTRNNPKPRYSVKRTLRFEHWDFGHLNVFRSYLFIYYPENLCSPRRIISYPTGFTPWDIFVSNGVHPVGYIRIQRGSSVYYSKWKIPKE